MSRIAAAITLVVASVVVYHNALRASFFDDDFQWLVGSWSFHPSQLVAFASMNGFYRPVVNLYFAAMTPLLRGSPVLFHAAAIALHVATVLVVCALAARIARDRTFGFITALLFAVQPSDIDAIGWVSAVSESASALVGCLALLWFLRWRDEGAAHDGWLSMGTYTLALLTHESSVVLLPVMLMLDRLRTSGVRLRPWLFLPYVIATVVYVSVDLYINAHALASQGTYTIGLHMVRSGLDYINALYVGRHNVTNDVAIAIGLVLLLWFGSARVRFATLWMLLALAPFLGFTSGNTSRYLYLPAVGFSMLLAEGATSLGRGARAVSGGRVDAPVASLVIAAIVAIRFGIFAQANVTDFAARSHTYSAFLATFRQAHPAIASNTTVRIDPEDTRMPYRYVNAAVQWEYRDPTIRVAPYE